MCAVIGLKNERGIITKGNCFELDENQGRILNKFKEDHQNAKKVGDLKIRNLYVSGPFGCGKTVILVEVCWMRIYFCLRMILEQGELDFFFSNINLFIHDVSTFNPLWQGGGVFFYPLALFWI